MSSDQHLNSLCTIRKQPHGDGVGVFARQHIPTGTVIYRELPLFSCQYDEDDDPEFAHPIAPGVTSLLCQMEWIHRHVFGLQDYRARLHLHQCVAAYRTLNDNDRAMYDGLWPPYGGELVEFYTQSTVTPPDETERRRMIGIILKMELNGRSGAFGTVQSYHIMSRFNHSCDPNTKLVSIPGNGWAIQAVRDIGAGQEIMTTYLTANLRSKDTKTRREALKVYGFTCQCIKCGPAQHQVHNDIPKHAIILPNQLRIKAERLWQQDQAFSVREQERTVTNTSRTSTRRSRASSTTVPFSLPLSPVQVESRNIRKRTPSPEPDLSLLYPAVPSDKEERSASVEIIKVIPGRQQHHRGHSSTLTASRQPSRSQPTRKSRRI